MNDFTGPWFWVIVLLTITVIYLLVVSFKQRKQLDILLKDSKRDSEIKKTVDCQCQGPKVCKNKISVPVKLYWSGQSFGHLLISRKCPNLKFYQDNPAFHKWSMLSGDDYIWVDSIMEESEKPVD